MYYDIDRILREELEAVTFLLEKLEKVREQNTDTLEKKPGKKESVYYRRFYSSDETGAPRRNSERLGNERHPKVIEIKQKMYNEELYNHLQEAKEFLERSIGIYKGYDIDTIDNALTETYRDHTGLVNKDPVNMTAAEWSRRPYMQNDFPFQNGRNLTSDGTRVRSKSEIILYDQLTFLGIPFRNDVPIPLMDENGVVIHKDADFQIGVLQKRKPVVEHLGLLVDAKYLNKAMSKVQLYIKNGYVLNETLFLTADDRDNRINAYATMQLFRKLILPMTTMKKVDDD